ncbi:unnamed protein product [Calypogeia fissa]
MMARAGSFMGLTTILWSTALLTWMLCQSRNVAAIPGFGLDSALNQAESDPLADNDVFETLSSSLKKALLKDVNLDTQKKIESLKGFESTTVIHVKLVGFPGEGDRSKQNIESQFARYIDAVNQEARVGVIASDSHEFMVKAKITVDVTRGSKKLTEKIHKAVKEHIDSVTPTRGSGAKLYFTPVQAVPYGIVDDIIQEDLVKPLNSYTVYLLNTKAQERSYAYEYGSDSPSLQYQKCLGTFWTGKERYLWIDLAAGPVEYGPSTSGDGYVKGEMFPLAKNYNDYQLKNAYLADLAAMVWSAARMLFVPSVRVPVTYERDTEVHIMHIQGANTTDDTKGVELNLIQEVFAQEEEHLLLPKQSLKFKYFNLKFTDCPLCAAALARAQKAFTSRVFLERYSLFVDDYLDSRELHEFLSNFGPDLAEQMKINAGPMARVLPVFILDVDSERQLLLDHYHQVIPFNDMVIAVRSKAPQVVTEYSCNGRPMVAQTRLLERPVVGALLQTLWGVAPSHVTWSLPHNDSLEDYRWALGQTPFGPFSDSMALSFAQKDAAPRNILYSMLNQSISTALGVLNIVKEYGGEKTLFGNRRQIEFSQRWSLFSYKLGKAVSGISHFDFKTALYFLKSAEHDIFAMHNLAFLSSGDLAATMICYTDPPFPWLWVGFGLLLILAGAYLLFRGPKIFQNKKKRF